MWSFLSVSIHTEVGHTDTNWPSQVSTTFLTRENSQVFLVLLTMFEPRVIESWVRRSTNWATPLQNFNRPDMTFTVDWALNLFDKSIDIYQGSINTKVSFGPLLAWTMLQHFQYWGHCTLVLTETSAPTSAVQLMKSCRNETSTSDDSVFQLSTTLEEERHFGKDL